MSGAGYYHDPSADLPVHFPLRSVIFGGTLQQPENQGPARGRRQPGRRAGPFSVDGQTLSARLPGVGQRESPFGYTRTLRPRRRYVRSTLSTGPSHFKRLLYPRQRTCRRVLQFVCSCEGLSDACRSHWPLCLASVGRRRTSLKGGNRGRLRLAAAGISVYGDLTARDWLLGVGWFVGSRGLW